MPAAILDVFFFCLGAVFASFAAVVAERVHTGQSFWTGRSRCNSCNRFLTALDLLPVVSWLASRGRCRTCGSRLPLAYVLGEALLGTLFLLSYLHVGLTPLLVALLAFLCVLFFVVIYDLRHMIVPPWASGVLIVLGAAVLLLSGAERGGMLLTIGIAALIALGFYLLYALSRGRAMGLGDTPVAFALSLFAGPQAYPGLLFSFWVGAVVGIVILLRRRGGPTMGIEIPFVPFLAAGFLLAFFTQWNPLVW